MTVEVTCDCGNGVPFVIEGEDKAPITATCDECGQRWKLAVKRMYP